MEQRRLIKRKDIIIIAAVVLLCALVLVWYATRKQGDTAVISCDGKVVKEINLTDAADQQFTLEGNDRVHFEVKNHTIRFVNVDCPDKICERVGYISKQGETAVCMPNKTTLSIVASKGDTDIMVQ